MLTPEEQLELEEIQKERQALEAEQTSITQDIVEFEKTQQQAMGEVPEAADLQPQDTQAQPNILERIGKSVAEVAGPVSDYVGETTEATARQFEQGLASGYADEARARIRAANTGRPYEEVLKEVQAEEEEIRSKSPVASAVGGLGGAIAQGMAITSATGGLGAPVAAVNVASKAAKLGKAITTIAKGIGTGAAAGFVAGTGESKRSLKD
jgi:Mrp family chromosome partitioning ATPase